MYEAKVNGWRALVHVPTRTVFNRHGQLMSIAQEFNDALWELKESYFEAMWPLGLGDWLDCEMLSRRHGVDKGHIIILDLVVPDKTYLARQTILHVDIPEILDEENLWPAGEDTKISTLTPTEDPFTLWDWMQKENKELGCDYYEGLVGKRVDSAYEHQLVSASRTTPHWIKYRFDQYTTK